MTQNTTTTPITPPPPPPIRPLSRTKTGCLTCRRRKKKCDERRPFCTGCHRNNIICQWSSPSASQSQSQSHLIPRPRRHRRRQADKPLLPGQAQGMVNVFSVLTPDIVSRLLRHFLDASPRWLSTRTGAQRTGYLRWLAPALQGSCLVRGCVLAIASADLLKYCRGDGQVYRAAVEFYGQAVAGIRGAVEGEMEGSGSDSGSDYTTLSVLLLCLHETQNFTNRERILPHLNAAAFLLQNRISSGNGDSMDPALRGFLFEMFCYFFPLAAFSLGPKLSISLSWADRIFASPSVMAYIRNGHIMGTSQHLFIAIYRIALLGQKLVSGQPDQVSAARRELILLDRELISRQTDFTPTEYSMDLDQLSDAITSALYSLACRIHIKRLLLLAPSQPDTENENEDAEEEEEEEEEEEDSLAAIQSLVTEFIHTLHHLPPDSPSHNIMSWPLVVAGFSASSAAHQRIIAAKLDIIYTEWQSAIFSKGAAFLREKWRGDRRSTVVANQEPVTCTGLSARDDSIAIRHYRLTTRILEPDLIHWRGY
ncbi:hypothetical protein BO70DRAFT_426171 [Aspergillus heteromorphus CBS 117.55]|uniref:Zn(2)-C6 fungal-type domain-containing protein n=1 Tax=Aspergillus heteromorphus CBS 117.55 TaxID=1448321 RepID=A0A317WWZ6_9EURO|nr:uncharacterized protein BO70DRAFT_426171 [Aspergillus heteromorphus CBS 117.55]PWY89717.1 hypothetical protein BO70DRAFT_426171 [Aspergillus heteromorphus CBS 117.55]